MYARIESGSVVEGPRVLPDVWKNISNFSGMSDAEKITQNWYPVEITKPEYDRRIQTRTGPVFTVLMDQVQSVWTVTDLPLAEVKSALITQLKEETRDRIYANAPDYMQRNAALGILSQEEIDTIKNTIETHRTACHATETTILDSVTAQDAVNAYDLWSIPST